MNKKHIVLIQFYEETPESIENIKRRAAFLGKYLAENNFRVTWIKSGFCHSSKKDLFGDSIKELSSDFKIIHVPGIGYKHNVCIKRYLHDFVCSKQMLKVLKKLGHIDCILTSIPSVFGSYFAAKYALKNNIPYVLDLRDAWPDAFPFAVYNIILRQFIKLAILPECFLLKYVLRHSSAIVSMSNDMLNWGLKKIKKYTNPTSVFYLSTTEDVTLSANEIEAFSKKYSSIISRKTFKCFYISKFGRGCQPIILIDTARLMKSYNVDFILCGNGDYEEDIKKNASGVENVFLPGFLEHKEAFFLSQNCHCGITFISNESSAHDVKAVHSFPNKVFFQFMCGMPLINGMKGELNKVVEEKKLGLNFLINDTKIIRDNILKLKNDDCLRLNLAKNSRQFFENHCQPKNVYNSYVNFLKNIVH